jgi:transposase
VRQIARSLSLAHSTVSDLIERAKAAGLTWPLPAGLSEVDLERKLYPGNANKAHPRSMPDLEWIHRELHRKGVTLQLLWLEYKQNQPDGYQYSQFCQLYRKWCRKLDVVMRQSHRAGEKLFVDYAGQTVPVVDPATGEVRPAQIFVAVLGASSYAYAEATWSQDLSSWIAAHTRAFAFFGGVTEVIVPDNLKAGVTHPSRYEPDLNPTYQEMAAHYGTVVIPARPEKPRDKAKVEVGVQVVERWILAVLRNRTFFSLDELNQAIGEALERLNNRPFKKLAGSRRSLFEQVDKPALKPLPPTPYEFAQWKKARVNIDYHVAVDGNYYSVPYQLVREEVDVRFTASTVEVLYKGERVASHRRSYRCGQYVTVTEHMPRAHQKHLEWSPSRLVNWAQTIGPQTAGLVQAILAARPHPEHGYRSCLGIIHLSRLYSADRLEAAAARALACRAFSYRSLKSILEAGLDKVPVAQGEAPAPVPEHANLRGAAYFAGEKAGCLPC